MARRKKSSRAVRRDRARTHEKLVRDLERLAHLEPGGSAELALVVASPAEVEVIALGRPCPLCGGSLRLEEHAAETAAGGASLRIAHVTCTACRTRRAVYFRLASTVLH